MREPSRQLRDRRSELDGTDVAEARAQMSFQRTVMPSGEVEHLGRKIKLLVGSGDKIGSLALPFLLFGSILNIFHPSLFSVGGPPLVLETLSIVALVPGVAIWAWSAILILENVPGGRLITSGPYALVKHPLYTSVALLVAPSVGFLLDTWLGALVGVVLYIGSRLFSPEEERGLSKAFGASWDEYCSAVKMPWL